MSEKQDWTAYRQAEEAFYESLTKHVRDPKRTSDGLLWVSHINCDASDHRRGPVATVYYNFCTVRPYDPTSRFPRIHLNNLAPRRIEKKWLLWCAGGKHVHGSWRRNDPAMVLAVTVPELPLYGKWTALWARMYYPHFDAPTATKVPTPPTPISSLTPETTNEGLSIMREWTDAAIALDETTRIVRRGGGRSWAQRPQGKLITATHRIPAG